jgi:4-hydroxyproline epimerase
MPVHTFSCLDGHTCGNPVRLVSGGVPLLKGNTMSERRLDFLEHHDWIRRALMFEPRGHDVMSGSMLYPPTRAAATSPSTHRGDGCRVRPRHDRHRHHGVENGLVPACRACSTSTPAGRVVARYEQRPVVEACASPTLPRTLPRPDHHRRAPGRECSTSPMAATTTPSSSRRRTSAVRRIAGDVLRLSPFMG